MRKIITIALLSILLLSCSSEYQYPDIGKSDNFEVYSNFDLLELSRDGLEINTNGYEQIVVVAKQNSIFENYYFKASASNRIGEAFILKLPATEMKVNEKVIFNIPKFKIELLEEKDTEVTYLVITGNYIVEEFKYKLK